VDFTLYLYLGEYVSIWEVKNNITGYVATISKFQGYVADCLCPNAACVDLKTDSL